MKKFIFSVIILTVLSLSFGVVNSVEAKVATKAQCQAHGGYVANDGSGICWLTPCGNLAGYSNIAYVCPPGMVQSGNTCVTPTAGSCNATPYYCNAGSAAYGTITGDYWTWSCLGIGGGSNASCSKEICAGQPTYNQPTNSCVCPSPKIVSGTSCVFPPTTTPTPTPTPVTGGGTGGNTGGNTGGGGANNSFNASMGAIDIFRASPPLINKGGSCIIQYSISSNGATLPDLVCKINNILVQATTSTKSETYSNVQNTTNYTFTCTGNSGAYTESKTATCNVVPGVSEI